MANYVVETYQLRFCLRKYTICVNDGTDSHPNYDTVRIFTISMDRCRYMILYISTNPYWNQNTGIIIRIK